jgi:hypothetical protein
MKRFELIPSIYGANNKWTPVILIREYDGGRIYEKKLEFPEKQTEDEARVFAENLARNAVTGLKNE